VLADPGQTMSQYITFALAVGPAPNFEYTMRHEDLPPDVLGLEGFNRVLADFYREAQIEERWKEFEPAYERTAQLYRDPMAKLVFVETGYLRQVLRASRRTFRIYVEPLVGGRTNFRNVGDQYAVVLSPEIDATDEVRHAFLHFLLDPLPIRYADAVAADAPLEKLAERAPRLPDEFRGDVSAFFTECLVRAVELRLQKMPAVQMTNAVATADAQGYVLVRPLVAGLAKFEASEPPMSSYFPELVKSIDVASESKRIQALTFTSGTAEDAEPARVSEGNGALSRDVGAALAAGERSIAEQDAKSAEAAFERVLERVPGQPSALYGLAVASVLEGNGSRAQDLFEQVVAAASNESASRRPDAVALAWSHVYLGRIHDLEGDRDQALSEYRAALAVADAPEAARVAAQRGLSQGHQPPEDRAEGNSKPG